MTMVVVLPFGEVLGWKDQNLEEERYPAGDPRGRETNQLLPGSGSYFYLVSFYDLKENLF